MTFTSLIESVKALSSSLLFSPTRDSENEILLDRMLLKFSMKVGLSLAEATV